MTYEEITENFSILDEWEERYQYILELGKKLLPFPEIKKNETYQVKGCVSQVWLDYKKEGNIFYFFMDSDSALVKGLLFIIISLYSAHTAQEINEIDFQNAFNQIQLNDHITPQRSNGVISVIKKIHSIVQL